jgi:hypothetical protein
VRIADIGINRTPGRGANMDQSGAVKISYWAYPEGTNTIKEPIGIVEFRNDLAQSYVSLVRGRPSGFGGGFYQLAIEFVAAISIHDVLKLIADGIAFDLLKSGTKAFILKPLLLAYERLKNRNSNPEVDIHVMNFIFKDAEIIVTKIGADSIYTSLGDIFKTLADSHEALKNRNGEFPYTIYIPVFEDPARKFSRYRMLLEVEETITNITSKAYFEYWGIRYDFECASRAFDVKRQLLIDEHFLTQDEYERRNLRSRGPIRHFRTRCSLTPSGTA